MKSFLLQKAGWCSGQSCNTNYHFSISLVSWWVFTESGPENTFRKGLQESHALTGTLTDTHGYSRILTSF